MFSSLAKKVFGDSNARETSRLAPQVKAITSLEAGVEALDDKALRARTDDLRGRVAAGESLDALLPEAFATVREAARRTIGQRHFDVQMMGGMVLHQGRITEMKTGEGKTLVATLAAYLNALEGKGVHIVTVNDYLAKRDSQWMGQIYEFLGLSVGCVTHELDDAGRREAYGADITYVTNNELGFDYLRDNMKFGLDEMVQREPHYAIVDEVDSILIDEARTPLIISGPSDRPSALYDAVNGVIPGLVEADYDLNEKDRSVNLTEDGIVSAEKLLREAGLMEDGTLYDAANITLLHHVNMALRAHRLFARDTHYMVKGDSIVIIDEFTGRAMEGRRFGDGQHQAIEAKEGVTVAPENQTLASITYQNLFRMYPRLAGMTGTALTEAGEFSEIYGLEVIAIPTNMLVARTDHDDEVYRTSAERDLAVIKQIEDCRKRGQPVLVGTVTIEKSEALSAELEKSGIPHQVLNARFHEQEAMIIAEAGVPGNVTIATNMAGRGTDIQLGGNLEKRLAESDDLDSDKITGEVEAAKSAAIKAGGLYVIGTERHESRRIDNQLRGRSGRQGDPGDSKFYISLEDDLMRIFGSERLDGVLQKLGLDEGEAIIHPWINKAIEKAQGKVEARNFEIRKQLLKYDDVMNDQRRVIFDQRKDIMRGEDAGETITAMRSEVIAGIVADAIPEGSYPDAWNAESLRDGAMRYLGLDIPAKDWLAEDGVDAGVVVARLEEGAAIKMADKTERFTPETMRLAEKSLLLQVLDQQWKDHLLALDHMKQAVGLRAYAQKDPLNEYKREAFQLFEEFLGNLRSTTVAVLSHVEMQRDAPNGNGESDGRTSGVASGSAGGTAIGGVRGGVTGDGVTGGGASPAMHAVPEEVGTPVTTTAPPPGRNAPCPCGSGKKYKHCCGKA